GNEHRDRNASARHELRPLPEAGSKELAESGSDVRNSPGPHPASEFLTGHRTSGPIPKFVSYCGTLVYELRNLRTTSNTMILVPFLNPKFAIAFAARCARTSGSGH